MQDLDAPAGVAVAATAGTPSSAPTRSSNPPPQTSSDHADLDPRSRFLNKARDMSMDEIRAYMRTHFGIIQDAAGSAEDDGGDQHKPKDQQRLVQLWDELWKDNFIPWDRGVPNPALVDIIKGVKYGALLPIPTPAAGISAASSSSSSPAASATKSSLSGLSPGSVMTPFCR